MDVSLKQYAVLLGRYLKPHRWSAGLLGLLLLGSIGLDLVNPQIVRYFLDAAQSSSALYLLITAALLYIGLAMAGQLVAIVETYVAENVAWLVTNQMRTELALHCLRLDRSFHTARTPGELIERIDGDVTALANFFSRFVVYVLGNALLLLGVLVALYYVAWSVGLAMTLFAVAATAILLGTRNLAVPYWTAVRQASADFFGFLGERLTGMEDIRSSGAGGYVLRRMTEIYRRWLRLEMKGEMAWAGTDGSTLVVFTLGVALALGLSAWLYRQGAFTIGTAYLIFQYTELLRRPLEQIRMQIQDLQRAAASIGRIEGLFAIEPRIRDGAGARLPAGPLAVALEDVSFGYEDGEPVLQEVRLDLAPGRVLGVLGHTGSGKTTLTRLLLRFHDPDAGVVRLGGSDVRSLRLADLRQRIGVVTQEVQLFRASLHDNLTLFNPRIDDARIVGVLEALGLGSWYRSLPAGLDSNLSAGGGLSAGEAQLLAFARVFLKDAGLVILDEASSRLDPATERLIGHATEALLRGRTGIIIAHRLATVERADDVLILEHGRIQEYGAREQLAADPESRYARLRAVGFEVAYA